MKHEEADRKVTWLSGEVYLFISLFELRDRVRNPYCLL